MNQFRPGDHVIRNDGRSIRRGEAFLLLLHNVYAYEVINDISFVFDSTFHRQKLGLKMNRTFSSRRVAR